jgi:hypothetical protein
MVGSVDESLDGRGGDPQEPADPDGREGAAADEGADRVVGDAEELGDFGGGVGEPRHPSSPQ